MKTKVKGTAKENNRQNKDSNIERPTQENQDDEFVVNPNQIKEVIQVLSEKNKDIENQCKDEGDIEFEVEGTNRTNSEPEGNKQLRV